MAISIELSFFAPLFFSIPLRILLFRQPTQTLHCALPNERISNKKFSRRISAHWTIISLVSSPCTDSQQQFRYKRTQKRRYNDNNNKRLCACALKLCDGANVIIMFKIKNSLLWLLLSITLIYNNIIYADITMKWCWEYAHLIELLVVLWSSDRRHRITIGEQKAVTALRIMVMRQCMCVHV